MVKIRLRRVGAKKQPHYRVVVADSRSPRDGRFIETIGNYNPRTEPPTMEIDAERALYWLGVGAQPSEAVKRMLDKLGITARAEAIKRGEVPGEPVSPDPEEAEEDLLEVSAEAAAKDETVPAEEEETAEAESSEEGLDEELEAESDDEDVLDEELEAESDDEEALDEEEEAELGDEESDDEEIEPDLDEEELVDEDIELELVEEELLDVELEAELDEEEEPAPDETEPPDKE